jgi:uncharacterized membrane protein YkvA (DUF1232 family)
VETWLLVLLAIVAATAVVAFAGWWLLRRLARRPQPLVERIAKLSWKSKGLLAIGLMRDQRLPLAVRLAVPLVVVYLALPLDLIPDFIPVIGQLDDLLLILVALRLVLRLIPPGLLEEHIASLEEDQPRRLVVSP